MLPSDLEKKSSSNKKAHALKVAQDFSQDFSCMWTSLPKDKKKQIRLLSAAPPKTEENLRAIATNSQFCFHVYAVDL